MRHGSAGNNACGGVAEHDLIGRRRPRGLLCLDEHKSAAARNLEVYVAWRDGGYHGQFDGTLVY